PWRGPAPALRARVRCVAVRFAAVRAAVGVFTGRFAAVRAAVGFFTVRFVAVRAAVGFFTVRFVAVRAAVGFFTVRFVAVRAAVGFFTVRFVAVRAAVGFFNCEVPLAVSVGARRAMERGALRVAVPPRRAILPGAGRAVLAFGLRTTLADVAGLAMVRAPDVTQRVPTLLAPVLRWGAKARRSGDAGLMAVVRVGVRVFR